LEQEELPMVLQSSPIRWLFAGLWGWGLLGAWAIPARAESPSDKPLALAAGDTQLNWGPCPPLFPKGCEIAVLHGDPTKPNADVFFKVPAGYTIPPHWHTSAERMVLVSGELHVDYAGHSPSVLKPGTYAYGPPKAPHKAWCTDTGPCVLFIAFESPVDAHPAEGSQK
jgi:quercetin dioxygenase-like cupin family protein